MAPPLIVAVLRVKLLLVTVNPPSSTPMAPPHVALLLVKVLLSAVLLSALKLKMAPPNAPLLLLNVLLVTVIVPLLFSMAPPSPTESVSVLPVKLLLFTVRVPWQLLIAPPPMVALFWVNVLLVTFKLPTLAIAPLLSALLLVYEQLFTV